MTVKYLVLAAEKVKRLGQPNTKILGALKDLRSLVTLGALRGLLQ